MTQIIACILAGGASRRMGADKASMLWRGASLLSRVAQACAAAGMPTMVVGRPLPGDWTLAGIDFHPDDHPGGGPLAALCTALAHCPPDCLALALACDMPLIDRTVLDWLRSEAQRLPPAADGLITVNEGRPEPLFCLYRAHLRAQAQALLANERRSLQALIDSGNFVPVALPRALADRMLNVNTPDDLAALGMKRAKIE